MRSHSYLNSARRILDQYKGDLPFAIWLKDYFRQDKKFGSRDRREISHLCYSFFRLGNAYRQKEFEERLLLAVFLCSNATVLALKELKPEWNEAVALPLEEKIKMTGEADETGLIFPWPEALSPMIDAAAFHRSFLSQPDVFLRIRPGRKNQVQQKLKAAGLQEKTCGENCLALNNQAGIDELFNLDSEVVVQDLSSQKVLEPLEALLQRDAKIKVWDCCAASGGKSILFHDQYPKAHLTVSDVRPSILINLKNRFRRAGIVYYDAMVADLTDAGFKMDQHFDLIICDAPCSGSGTWGRTPEQLSFFQKEKIEHYTSLQKKIALRAARQLKTGGYFLYITCSVYKKENEELVVWLQQQVPLSLVSMQYFTGYEEKADTLFVALFSL